MANPVSNETSGCNTAQMVCLSAHPQSGVVQPFTEMELKSGLKTLNLATYLCFFIFGISETSNVEPVFGWNLFFSKLSFPRHLLSSYPFVYDDNK